MPTVLDPADSLKREAFKALVGLRRDHPVLARGSFHEIYKDWSIFAFLRADDADQLLVVLNTASTEEYLTIPVPSGMTEHTFQKIHGEGGLRPMEEEWWLRIPPTSMTVWESSGPSPTDLPKQVDFTDRLSSDFEEITLVYLDPERSHRSIGVAGDFNNWKAQSYANERRGDSLVVTLPLKPGTYEYKLVLDGRDWIADPLALEQVVDPYGGQNSILTIIDD
jgi:hypothetical protein